MSIKTSFATYLYPHTCYTSHPIASIMFVGQSIPYHDTIRSNLEQLCSCYPKLPLRKAELQDYYTVHPREYLDAIIKMSIGDESVKPPRLSIECTGLEYCLPGYLYGLGGMLEAIDRMQAGAVDRVYCFSPGGHHAYTNWGHGYCLLNPQAAAVRYAQARGFKKVLIIDWDLHHGDGTQSIFANDPDVHCISIHNAVDVYMAIMRVMSKGTTTEAEKTGHCNIPLLDASISATLYDKFHLTGSFYRFDNCLSQFTSALERVPWSPDLISIFSGYDAHGEDCGKNITNWSNADYRQLTHYATQLARRAHCPILSIHGGGYKAAITVGAAMEHIKVLADAS